MKNTDDSGWRYEPARCHKCGGEIANGETIYEGTDQDTKRVIRLHKRCISEPQPMKKLDLRELGIDPNAE